MAGDRSFSEVVQDIIGNVQEIVRSEVRLATEMREEAAKANPRRSCSPQGSSLPPQLSGVADQPDEARHCAAREYDERHYIERESK
jgi:hypothetical protein